MSAIAKRLFRGCTTTTKRHPFFNGERISIRVLEFNRSSNNVRAVLNRLDSYVSHGDQATYISVTDEPVFLKEIADRTHATIA